MVTASGGACASVAMVIESGEVCDSFSPCWTICRPAAAASTEGFYLALGPDSADHCYGEDGTLRDDPLDY